MARRVRGQPLAARALLAGAALGLGLAAGLPAPAGAGRSGLLVHYSFDDEGVETGPDTFRVFEHARGSVVLSSAFRMSGYHAVEIRDVAGDGDFPELQGYFPLRRQGTLFVHFAFLVTDPRETLNAALAGPGGFQLGPDGIAVWLRTRDGVLYHVSDSMPKRLLRLSPFTWYRVDLAYDVRRGRYDLAVSEERRLEQLVFLPDQPNAASQPGSGVDKFSFIGDRGTDTSNVLYYVDDVVVSADEPVPRLELIAPGRRKLFFDRELAVQAWLRRRPGCPPPTELADFGVGPQEARSLLRAGLLPALDAHLRGAPAPLEPEPLGPSATRRLAGLRRWAGGCRALADGDAAAALAHFEAASLHAPDAPLYPLSALLALAALGRLDEAEARWERLEREWRGDPHYPSVMAQLGLARGDLDEAERWLAGPAEAVAAASGPPDALSDEIAARAFYVLLWQQRFQAAERLALALAERAGAEAAASTWLERAADAAVLLADPERAVLRYEAALARAPDAASLVLKLSDLYFLRGDLERERLYRERIYGTLRPREPGR